MASNGNGGDGDVMDRFWAQGSGLSDGGAGLGKLSVVKRDEAWSTPVAQVVDSELGSNCAFDFWN